MNCPKCGSEMEIWVNTEIEPIHTRFLGICPVCGYEEKVAR